MPTTKKDANFYDDMQRYIAVTTIGPSTLRNQGSKGVIKAAQKYLCQVDLPRFRAKNESSFLQTLDRETKKLKKSLPRGRWGAARKALNLFLRDIWYNRFLCQRHRLSGSEHWLELPLDSFVAKALRNERRAELPPWPGLRHLTPEVSKAFQCVAKKIACDKHISRVHLDMLLWLDERESA